MNHPSRPAQDVPPGRDLGMIFLFDEAQLRKRCNTTYDHLRTRAKPKKYKQGKRKGSVRVPGIDQLPFTREQLWKHVLNMVGPSATRCPYCVAIGRTPRMITLADFVLDHKIPVARGGPHQLHNLVCVCADCNNLKGHLSYPFFIGIMTAIEAWPDHEDRKAMFGCMRTHGVAMRFKFGGKESGPAAPDDSPVAPTAMPLALCEDW